MKLHSQIFGEGAPLLIMHGVFGMGDNWKTLARRWSEHYQVHVLDMRNHGRSPHSEAFSYEVMSDDVREYLEDHGLSSAHLLGHSMGGKVGMLFACLYPEHTRSLTVADIGPQSYRPHHEQVVAALEGLDLSQISSRREAQEQFGPDLPPGVRQFLLKNLYWESKESLGWRFNLPVLARSVRGETAGLPPQAQYDGPVLFVRGGRSAYLPDEALPQLHEHFPQAQLKTLPEAGHWLHAEQPQAFYELIQAFLSGQ